jgi:hypothetical protein
MFRAPAHAEGDSATLPLAVIALSSRIVFMEEIYPDKAICLANGIVYKQSTITNTEPIFRRIRCGSTEVITVSKSEAIDCQGRFQQRLRDIIYRLFSLIGASPCSKDMALSDAPISMNFWMLLSTLHPEEVFEVIHRHFPSFVQETVR